MYLLNELDKLTALTLSYSTNKAKPLYYDAFDTSNDPRNKGELTSFCEAFFQIVDNSQSEIIADLSRKNETVEKLSEITQDLDIDLAKQEKEILYVIGQHYIFGIKGSGMSKKELEIIFETSEYAIRNALKKLRDKGYIVNTKSKPIEVTLSNLLGDKLQ